ncbi:30497_t:CDS:2 [Racocetra persica]|uniref:30497_t:CDS:1 n=1 Tax=Racocetra persica TaxID=160502 RepID=A0ACA9KR47_9GLOM|nr:30497_t:CDS:2 [Racocetra persica]
MTTKSKRYNLRNNSPVNLEIDEFKQIEELEKYLHEFDEAQFLLLANYLFNTNDNNKSHLKYYQINYQRFSELHDIVGKKILLLPIPTSFYTGHDNEKNVQSLINWFRAAKENNFINNFRLSSSSERYISLSENILELSDSEGAYVILKTLSSLFIESAKLTSNMTFSQKPLEYLAEVLVLETAIRLIAQDQNITLDELAKVIGDSIEFGMYMHDIEEEDIEVLEDL